MEYIILTLINIAIFYRKYILHIIHILYYKKHGKDFIIHALLIFIFLFFLLFYLFDNLCDTII